MNGAGILIVGVLALVAVLVVSAAIVAMAPYLAAVIIVVVVVRYCREPGKPNGDLPGASSTKTDLQRRR